MAARLKALRFSGRLMVIFATAPRFSNIVYLPSLIMNKILPLHTIASMAHNIAILAGQTVEE
jgi:hypothetical protein